MPLFIIFPNKVKNEKNIFELMQSTFENPKESYLKLLAKRLGFYLLN
jgi:hypothetical protein